MHTCLGALLGLPTSASRPPASLPDIFPETQALHGHVLASISLTSPGQSKRSLQLQAKILKPTRQRPVTSCPRVSALSRLDPLSVATLGEAWYLRSGFVSRSARLLDLDCKLVPQEASWGPDLSAIKPSEANPGFQKEPLQLSLPLPQASFAGSLESGDTFTAQLVISGSRTAMYQHHSCLSLNAQNRASRLTSSCRLEEECWSCCIRHAN